MVNAKPRLSPWSSSAVGLSGCCRVVQPRTSPAEMGVSRATAYKWVPRFRAEGRRGLCWIAPAARTAARPAPTRRLEAADRGVAPGPPARAGPDRRHRRACTASTVHRVLVRHRMPRLAWLDRPTGRRWSRRYERARPGELVHVDVKKLGATPRPAAAGASTAADQPASTWPRRADAGRRVGYDYVHCAIDDHTRLAYAEIHPDEKADTCAGFLRRAAAWFAAARHRPASSGS